MGGTDIAPRGEHVPVLDGMRGLAILLVMARHFTAIGRLCAFDHWYKTFAWWGWIGVDLFFVLSGYLITGILLDAKPGPRFFSSFYARRVLRIFPLYYAVLALSFLVLPALLPPDKAARFGEIRGTEGYYWVYLQNFTIARTGGTRHAIVDITWSLAIEEQFYLVWPTVVLLCSPRALRRVCLALFPLSFAARLIAARFFHIEPFGLYVLTPCRMEGLAAGAFLASRAREPGGLADLVPRARYVLPAVGAVLVALLVHETIEHLIPDGTQPGLGPYLRHVGFPLLAVGFGALLVLIVEAGPTSVLHRVFASAPMRFLGTYSYALYLVHVPIRAVVRDRFYGPAWVAAPHRFLVLFGSELPGQILFYALVGVPIVATAWLSYHLYEKHFLKLKRLFSPGDGRRSARSRAAPG